MSAATPKVMLLTAGGPDRQTAGEVFVRDLCRGYGDGCMCRFALVHAGAERAADWLGMPVAYGSYPVEGPSWRFGKVFACVTASLRFWYHRRVLAPKLIEQATRFARERSVELVWSVVAAPLQTFVAREVAARLEVGLVVTVNDPPERWIEEQRLGVFARRCVMRDFRTVLRHSVSVATASENMRDLYRARYGVDSVVLIHGMAADAWREPRVGRIASDEFTIGVAGNLYAAEEWYALLSALREIDWNVAGRRVRIKVAGTSLVLNHQGPVDIEFLGWRSVEETLEMLAACDIAYLPYWFDPKYRTPTSLCFPNKLSAYLAAGCPVLFHGPDYSSPARFLSNYPVGVHCDSLDSHAIVHALEVLAGDDDAYMACVAAGRSALENELGHDVFVKRFRKFIERGITVPCACASDIPATVK